eukprot:CAMPEP_0119324002 /NCGR_PEP_ID=MMETSP1333-20130426/62119_1 /TAXON_ID=418940 /ORGANISM="Scyphosphaera apsteinii, Strain RCC1455" /LENGTH=95 /DNA_ID=CAMNT_0007331593 /DNA_START=65 /DNA_END=352 /DNA_ORIENTATION=+
MPVLAGLLAFTGAMAALPIYLHRRHMRLQNGVPMCEQDKPLSKGAVRRGAYLNSSSVDVGKDPDWDFKAGTYKGKPPTVVDASLGQVNIKDMRTN